MQKIVEATLAAAPKHPEQIYVLDKADGQVVTLPEAKGTGFKYTFIVATLVTSNLVFQVTGDDIMKGLALLAQDGGDTSVVFETAADTDTITLNGTTTGGSAGSVVELIDIDNDEWWVRVMSAATGVEATPFSAAVA